MKKVIFLIVLLAGIGLVGLWASGQPEGKSGTSGAAEKVTLQFWTRLGATPDEVNAIVKDWNQANPNTNVVVQNIPGDQYRTKLLTSIAGGNPPDVVGLDIAIMPQYMGQKALLALNSYIASEGASFKSDFGAGLWKGLSSNGNVYGVPWWADPSALIYNKKLLQENGLTPPKTWSELKQAAAKISRKTGNADQRVYGVVMPVVGPWVMWIWLPYLWSAGGSLLDANDCAAFNNQAGIDAMKLWVDMYHNGDMPRSAVFAKNTQAIDSAFFSGRVGMYTQGAGLIRRAAKVAPNLDAGVTVMPAPAGRTSSSYLGGDALVIMKSSKYPEQAWKLIAFAVDPSRMRHLAGANNGVWIDGLVTRSTVLTSDFLAKYPYQQAFVEAEKVGQAPTTHWLSEIRVPIWNGFQAALAGDVTVEKAIADAAVKVNQITGCKQ